ncbi:MAG TPA: nucleotidyltransferase substrate binding protein [Candidatus Babeliales bacterium]|nr:nucleotidyltransferase substrate binding protein [Candidatus Babeliales bacterium]
MESLDRKYENFKKCYEALGKSINTQNELEAISLSNPSVQNLFDTVNAGVIKHFELAYETGWKFLKEYLLIIYNREILSPKAVFRACEELQLFPQNILNELITLADARNETTHIYSKILAQEVCNSITKHYEVFGKILETVKMPLV